MEGPALEWSIARRKFLAGFVSSIFFTGALAHARDKRETPCDSNPTSEGCYAVAGYNGAILKAHMKNPDTFELQKVSITLKGDICFRYTAQSKLGLKVNSVAIWYRKSVPFGVIMSKDNEHRFHEDQIAYGFIDSMEDDAGQMRHCAVGTSLDVRQVLTRVNDTKNVAPTF